MGGINIVRSGGTTDAVLGGEEKTNFPRIIESTPSQDGRDFSEIGPRWNT